MRTESTELEHRETRELINQSQNWFFENPKTRPKDKTVANLSKGKKEPKENKMKSPNWEITEVAISLPRSQTTCDIGNRKSNYGGGTLNHRESSHEEIPDA